MKYICFLIPIIIMPLMAIIFISIIEKRNIFEVIKIIFSK
jgi:hypothetical protein